MLRLLAFLAILGLAAWGLSWLADNPGAVSLTWRGVEYNVSLMVALGVVLAAAVALSLAFALLRFVLRVPALASLAVRARRREKGFAALSRGMIAVGAGDAREAHRYAREAGRFFHDESLTKLLRAQAAQLGGDRAGAVAAFNDMLASDDTHLLGLRGLHVEARRAGQPEAALAYAKRAYERAAPPWAAQAVLDDFSARGDWANALATVETNARRGLIDRPTANRWRAVLKTALAGERADRDAKAALSLAREALDLAPSLVPAAVICGRLTATTGDLRKAARILETAYRAGPHPDLAEAYVRLRSGDSAVDRLMRAKALARIAPFDPESVLTVARGELEAQDLAAARKTLAPLLRGEGVRPTARACLLMAEIEEAAGDDGAVREWLARAARARRDRAWVAEGIIADRWAPAAPNGTLDAFVWRTPDERLADPPAGDHAAPIPAARRPAAAHRHAADPGQTRPRAGPPRAPACETGDRAVVIAARERPRRPWPACGSCGGLSEFRAGIGA
jgi:HemY protein